MSKIEWKNNEQNTSNKKSESNNSGGGRMDDRLNKLEGQVDSMKLDITVIKSNYSTKEDIANVRSEIHSTISNQTKWLAGIIIGVASIALAVARFLF
ncbi:hemolysin XhlA [Thorsellia kenyensis]|uniref:Hemolysin XhlA n=1 Tax=Thorsellia kenyensis TaxID=1549888 RepID=A0ABV6C7S1_9GAMM